MISLDDLPFSHVEDLGFIRFVHKAAPLYKLKIRKYYSEKILPDIYESLSKKVRHFLFDYLKLSFTTDIWTNDSAKVCLMSLTAHCIDESFRRKKFVLCATELDERHTGEYINEMFHKMLKRWSIPLEKVNVVLRDAGANVKKAMKLGCIFSFDCANHQLHLVVTEAVKIQRTIIDCIARVREIFGHFNHSPTAQAELKKIQTVQLKKETSLTPIQDVSTRWNTVRDMLVRHSELEDALRMYTGQIDLKSTDFKLILKITNTLEGFKLMTEKLSATTATMGDLFVLAKSLLSSLADRDDPIDSGIKSFRLTLREELNRRMGGLENNDMVVISTFLDPRFKGKFFSSKCICDHVRRKVAEAAVFEFRNGEQ